MIKDDTNFIRHGIDRTQYRELMVWILPTNFPVQQSDIFNRRQPGIGQWFFNASEVVQWFEQLNGTFFCPGIPGAGKTIIAAIAVDHLLETVQSSFIGVAYVYCNYKFQNKQSTGKLFAAFFKQLV